MPDDWSTVNAGRDKMTRELELLRQRYRMHREAVAGLIDDAPSEALAKRYEEMIVEIDASLEKLKELDSPPPSPKRTAPGTGPQPLRTGAPAAAAAATAAGSTASMAQPPPHPALAGSSAARSWDSYTVDRTATPASSSESNSPLRALAIILAGVAILGLLGFFAWRALSGDDEPDSPPPIVREETPADAAEPLGEPGAAGAPAAAAITITPAAQDYGVIRKGTRASRTFQIRNGTDRPVALQMARSQCRCLWFEYPDLIPASESATLTVIVDGAKARRGALRETIAVTASADPNIKAALQVIAEIE